VARHPIAAGHCGDGLTGFFKFVKIGSQQLEAKQTEKA
jgi:hypothetical protein